MRHSLNTSTSALVFPFLAFAAAAGCSTSDLPNGNVRSLAVPPVEFSMQFVSRYSGFGGQQPSPGAGIVVGMDAVLLDAAWAAIANFDHVLLHSASNDTTVKVGRKGDGPGEFSTLSRIYRAGAGFAVTDDWRDRILLYGPRGEYIRSSQITGGRIVGWLNEVGPVRRRGGTTRQLVYTMHDSLGAEIRELLRTEQDSAFSISVTMPSGAQRHYSLPPQCDPAVLEVVLGSTLFVTDQRAGKLMGVGRDGKVRELYESRERSTISAQTLETVRQTFVRAAGPALDRLLDRYGKIGDPLPVTWDRVIPDPSGRLWMRRATCASGAVRRWEVVDSSGTYIGSLDSDQFILAINGPVALVFAEDSGAPGIARWSIQNR